MSERFAAEGAGQLMTDVHRRGIPVPNDHTTFAERVVWILALGTALAGLVLFATGWRLFQAGPDRKPSVFWVGIAITQMWILPLLLPGPVMMALFILGVPAAISWTMAAKTWRTRRAALWPSTRGRIITSRTRTEHRSHAGSASTVVNIPVIEYDYTVGPNAFHGTHITGADDIGASLPAPEILARYPVGAAVPVYYNPAAPAEAVLERNTPWNPRLAYASAGVILMVGIAASAAFLRVDALMQILRAHFPPGAEPHLAIFFGLCGLWTVFVLWDDHRSAGRAGGWPAVTGRVVSSTTEQYRTRIGGRGGSRVTLVEPVVEYAYTANGTEYHSTQVAFGAAVAGGQAAADARIARYPPETDVLVHYDPANPSNAVLETSVAFAWPILVLALVFFGLAIFFSAVFR